VLFTLKKTAFVGFQTFEDDGESEEEDSSSDDQEHKKKGKKRRKRGKKKKDRPWDSSESRYRTVYHLHTFLCPSKLLVFISLPLNQ